MKYTREEVDMAVGQQLTPDKQGRAIQLSTNYFILGTERHTMSDHDWFIIVSHSAGVTLSDTREWWYLHPGYLGEIPYIDGLRDKKLYRLLISNRYSSEK